MKKTSELTLLTFFMSILSTFAALPNIAKYNATIVSSIKAQKIKIDIEVPKTEIKNVNQTSLFLTSIGRRESSNRYDIVNRWGYMGKYQFGRKTLNALGYKNISNKQFLSNPKLQEEAMVKLLKHNKHILRKEIRKKTLLTEKKRYIIF